MAIKTTSNQIQVGWLASQSDMLSNDWEVIE
ncbi:MW1434 family type I TA system toxin [Lactococcus lactis subsp. lactis]|nr:MW1434 family type I TA system toxin [Lactococcus lactis]MDY4362799.1 MW1434 family type I TA system toxin [Lactococcus lactis subsp. lactis]